jgi:hypothetical protein
MFKDMNDEDLRAAYWSLRTAIANSGNLGAACTTRSGSRKAAVGMDRNLRHLDIVCAIARKRGINLLK